MSQKIKSILVSIVTLFSIIGIICSNVSAATISGTVSYLGMTSSGKFWVWASTAPMGTEGSEPISLSSYTVDGNDINFPYELVIPDILLPSKIYVYAVRDCNPPYVEDYLANPQPGMNPTKGDPIGKNENLSILEPNGIIQAADIIVNDPPQGEISGTISISNDVIVSPNSILKIAVFHGVPQEGKQPVDYQEWQISGSYYFPFNYTLMYLPDATDYYVAAVLDDMNDTTPDPFAMYGPVTISQNTQEVSGIDLTLSISGGGGGTNYIEGMVYGTTTPVAGPLIIILVHGDLIPGNSPVASIRIENPQYPQYYRLEGLPEAMDYRILAFIDVNNDSNLQSNQEPYDTKMVPSFSNGKVTLDLYLQNPSGGGGGGVGTNSIKGNITYSGNVNTNAYVYVIIGLGDNTGIYQQMYSLTKYGLGSYEIPAVLPDGENYYISAFIDLNNNGYKDITEPYAYVGPFVLFGGQQKIIDIQLQDPNIEISTITVTIRGKVVDPSYQPLGGVEIRLVDTGGFNDYDSLNDRVIATLHSSDSFQTSESQQYNYEFTNIPVIVSNDNFYYNYKLIFKLAGYNRTETTVTFYSSDANSTKYLWEVVMQPKILGTVEDLSITPNTISPNNDGIDDFATISFKYTFNYEYVYNWYKAKFIVDTNKNGQFDLIDMSIFVYDRDKIYVKKDPNYFVDFSKPLDYSKLEGPITQDEYNRIIASKDTVVEHWIDSYNFQYDQSINKTVAYVSFNWDGKNSIGQPLPSAKYLAQLVIEDSYMDEVYKTTTTIEIISAVIIGQVKNEQGNPISGAKVTCNGPSGWAEGYTDDSGNFVLAGLKEGDYYDLNVRAKGYVSLSISNIQAKLNPTGADKVVLTLKKGVIISGNIIIPNPPISGSLDNNGYPMFDLWANIDAQNLSGSEWLFDNAIIPLPQEPVSVTSASFSIAVSPNSKYRLVVKTQGYVSKDLVVEVSTKDILGLNIELMKAVKLTGTVQIPNDEEFISELLNNVRDGFNVNVFAYSKDYKYWSGCWVWFSNSELTPGATKTFIIDNLTPNVTYSIGVEAELIAKKEIRNIYVGKVDKTLGQPIVLSLGIKAVGRLEFESSIYDKIKDLIQSSQNASVNIWIGLQSQKDFSWRSKEVYVSTSVIASGGYVDFTISGLQQNTKYKLELDMHLLKDCGLEYIPKDLIIEVSTTLVRIPTIEIVTPKAILKGKLVNNTGKAIDFNKVSIVAITFDGSDFKMATPNQNGEFIFTEMRTAFGLLWGAEYAVKPFEQAGNLFGIPSGNTPMFGKDFYTVYGSTVDIGTIELKQPGTIRVVLKGEPILLQRLYSQTTTYLAAIHSGQIPPDGPYGFIRVQPLWLKKIADIMDQMAQTQGYEDDEGRMTGKEIGIGLDETIEIVGTGNDTKLIYTFNAAEEGIWNINPMVGNLPVVRVKSQDGNGNNKITLDTIVSPISQVVIVKPGETKTVEFAVSEGVEITGSVIRPQLSVGSVETITVSLRDKVNGKVIMSYDVIFDSTTATLTTKSYKFTKVPPGDYILVVLSPNYKAYSKDLRIPFDVASLTLTPILLTKGANIVCRLIDVNGNPVISGVRVECMAIPFVEGSYKNTDMPGLGISSELTTAGQVKLTNLPAGTYVIRVSNKPDSYTNYVNTVKTGIAVPDSPVDVEVGDIVLKPAVEITGIVLSPENKPLANVNIVAYPQDVQLRKGMECWAKTDTNGRFRIKGINPNIRLWEVVFNKREENVTLENPELRKYAESVKSNINVTKEEYRTNLQVTLQLANAEIKGVVQTSDGGTLMLPFLISGVETKDFPAAVLLLQSEKDITSGDPMAGIKILTNSDGTFSIKGITKGKYLLKVFARGYATQVIPVEAQEGVNDIGTITLNKGWKVSGTIRTETGTKISKNNAAAVIASNKNYNKFVVGYVDYDPVTLEVEGYSVEGLEQGVTYYLIIVPEGADYLVVDPQPLVATSDNIERNLIFRKPKPHFEVKSYKFKEINKEYVKNWLKFFDTEDLSVLLSMPQDTWAKHLFIAQLLQEKGINVDNLSSGDIFDMYLIFGFVNEPIIAEEVSEIVSAEELSGDLLHLMLSDTKKQFVIGYVPKPGDSARGYFALKFSAVNYYGEKGEETYRFYLGEDAKVEKVITPLTGGSANIGEEDNSGLEVPPGTEFENVDVTSNTKIVITKLEEETVMDALHMKLSPKLFSTKLPSIAKASMPGELVSAIYDMQVRLISGPLATLAKNNKVKVKIQLSDSNLTQEDINSLKLCYYNETTGKWEIQDVPLEVNLTNLIASAEVTHLSKFAVFKVQTVANQPSSGKFNTYLYPNPVKNVDKFAIRVDLPGSGKVKCEIKIYNLAGELVRTIEQELDAGYINDITDIEATNDKGEKLASGIYFYYLKVGDYKKLYKFAIIK